MTPPTPDQFVAFYQAVHGYAPFPWQSRLAKQVCGGQDWPRAIALPTAAGKTACIDIAVFALACRALNAARRIFFVVDRRIVVDQAHRHADELAKVLKDADDGILKTVADSLRDIAGGSDERPLDVYALRGGMYRETAWARSPLQPTVIASTVDQVGSRLLFRGYGVSDSMKPVHAALVGNDALILLDEAHCAKPFQQTAEAVEKYRAWNDSPAPFRFVSITATPTADVEQAEKEREEQRPNDPPMIEKPKDDDLSHPVLGRRINAEKRAVLVKANKKQLLATLQERAESLMGVSLGKDTKGKEHTVQAVGVIVNRVKTARELAKLLLTPPKPKKGEPPAPPRKVILLTGRMRPLDRDAILKDLEPLFSGSEKELAGPTFVVATQCLEVGADLDFHALVTECASLDALRQRFGRLNRVADRPSAPAAIICPEEYAEPKEEEKKQDPIYRNSLPYTWEWLHANADGKTADAEPWINFGAGATKAKWDATDDETKGKLNAPSESAPVLFPAHLDCWVQTHPIPHPDPDVSVFLHGPKQAGQPDVQVVFRSDLRPEWTDEQITALWRRINPEVSAARLPLVGEMREAVYEAVVSLCPPASSEAVAVPISVFRDWVTGEQPEDDGGDAAGGSEEPEAQRGKDDPAPAKRSALHWQGEGKNRLVRTEEDVTPNATYIVGIPRPDDEPEQKAIRRIADLPDVLYDYADAAFQRSRDKGLLRFTPDAIADWPEVFRTAGVRELVATADSIEDRDEFAAKLDEVLDELADVNTDAAELRPWAWIPRAANALARPDDERHRKPTRRRECDGHPCGGVVLTGKIRLRQFDPTYLADSEPNDSFRGEPVSLIDHSRGVAGWALRFARALNLPEETYTAAGLNHDLGKLDPRFQAMLKNGSPRTAVGPPLAKSARGPKTQAERDAAREIHRYPKGARHELLSAALLANHADDLLLHLIATHHGSARPFASAVDDDPTTAPPALAKYPEWPKDLPAGSPAQTIAAWNAELPERFWRVVRTHGWWGTAFREAVFRLADHAQSREEQEGEATPPGGVKPFPLAPRPEPQRLHPLPLAGLDGTNPLAFLAAVGTLRLADKAFPGARLSWGLEGVWTPTLHLPEQKTQDELVAVFLEQAPPGRRSLTFSPDVKILSNEFRGFEVEAVQSAREDREFADFLRAYADPLVTIQGGPNAGKTKPTEFYFIAGQQRLLRLAAEIGLTCQIGHLTKCFHTPWVYDDSLDGLSLRWDPLDDFRYATRWRNPSKDNSKGKRGSVLGANRLAFEALPLFPCFAIGERLATTGFIPLDRSSHFTWPIWSAAWGVDVVRSVLSAVVPPRPKAKPQRVSLPRQFGVRTWYQCEKVANSDYSNFAPSRVVE